MKILIIEDDASFIVIISDILSGCKMPPPVVATSVEDAIPLIPEADIVITDYNYAGGGFEAIKKHLLKHRKPYILQSSSPVHDESELMLGFINKANLVQQLPQKLGYSIQK